MAVITFTAVAGTTYHFAVDGTDGSVGKITVGFSREGGGVTLPVNAVGIADFVNGGYQWGDTALVASDVVDHPERIVPGIGLVTPAKFDPNVPKFLNDIATYLLASDWTVVLEWYLIDDFASPLHIQDSTDDNPRLGVEDSDHYQLTYDLVGGNERDTSGTYVGGSGVANVTAVTRTDAKLAASFNGGTVDSVTTSQTSFAGAVDGAYVGGEAGSSYSAMVLGRIVIYPPQTDADLPGLAVPSGNFVVPSNNDFADATVIDVGDTLAGYNFFATKQAGEPNHAGSTAGKSVWWKFVAPADGDYTVDLAGSNADDWGLVLAIYTGSAVDSLTEVASSSTYPYPSIIFTAVGGTTYYVAVDGNGGGAGSIAIAVTAA